MAALTPEARSFGAWRLAFRLRTLPVAAAPVLVGTAGAAADGAFVAPRAAAALLGALFLQIGANLANDAFDHERGADGPDRLGPPRAAALGLLSPRALKRGTAVAFALAALAGGYLIFATGWPIAAIGLAGMLAAVGYVGPGAYGYRGLGDLAVFVFFGIVAVCASYWVQAGTLPLAVAIASLPMAGLATAVLVVNNLRDLDPDRRAGKRTLAVRLGARGARIEYVALVALAFGALPLLAAARGAPAVLLPLLSLPLAVRLVGQVFHRKGTALNETLAGTARLEAWFAALLAAGLLL